MAFSSPPRLLGACSALLACAALLLAPLWSQKINLTADFTAPLADGRYVNALGHVALVGRRSAWDMMASPAKPERLRQALRSALGQALSEAGPQLARGAHQPKLWETRALLGLSEALSHELGGQWSARSTDLGAALTGEPPGPDAPY
jgi:hypothetical protein